MPFSMKIQPIDSHIDEQATRSELVKPVVKSRFKRLFERQFPGVLRNPAAEKIGVEEPFSGKDGANSTNDFEPSSVCLVKMVQNFIEENHEKQSASIRCGRNRCNCFNGNCDNISEDESDAFGGFGDSNYSSTGEVLKGLVACASISERNLLADTAKILEKNKIFKRKDDYCRKIVTDGLLILGYDASICKSRWEKSPCYPAGEYEYIDVMMGNERVLIDIDFRSEFEIARSTKAYKTILQTLPHIFVGKSDRLQSMIAIVSEAAKQSLKKKGMHIPPWRKTEYVKAKWLSPYTRTTPTIHSSHETREKAESSRQSLMESGDFELSAREGIRAEEEFDESVFTLSVEHEKAADEVTEWKPPELKPKNSLSGSGVKVVTGLAAVFDDPTKF